MPFTATHILIPILLAAVFRDIYNKRNKTKFPLHYVLIAGLGGILPDIDIIISVILNLFGIENWNIHKTFTHSLFFPVVFFVLFLISSKMKAKAQICRIRRHKLKISMIFLAISFGILTHILLDSIFGQKAYFFYPFSLNDYGIDLVGYLPRDLRGAAFPLMDGFLVVIWIIYLEIKHKISDFI